MHSQQQVVDMRPLRAPHGTWPTHCHRLNIGQILKHFRTNKLCFITKKVIKKQYDYMLPVN